MRQLRSELVHAMSDNALEILGIGGQQADYREGRFDKATHPEFCHLRENNRFLGTGKDYLRSDQIVRVSELLHLGFNFVSDDPNRDSALLLLVQSQLRLPTGRHTQEQTCLICHQSQKGSYSLSQQL